MYGDAHKTMGIPNPKTMVISYGNSLSKSLGFLEEPQKSKIAHRLEISFYQLPKKNEFFLIYIYIYKGNDYVPNHISLLWQSCQQQIFVFLVPKFPLLFQPVAGGVSWIWMIWR